MYMYTYVYDTCLKLNPHFFGHLLQLFLAFLVETHKITVEVEVAGRWLLSIHRSGGYSGILMTHQRNMTGI